MDPVRRLKLVWALIQLDDQQNIVALQYQHQQVIRQCRLRRKRRWWCWPWLLRQPAFGQFEHRIVELRIEDPASFQNFVRCEPAMFQEMVDRLTPLICKLDTNYRKALEPGLKVDIALRYMATWNSSKSLQYGFHVAYNTLFADSWGHFCHSGRLPWRGHCNAYHSWRLDSHCQHQHPQVTLPSLPWGNRW